MIIYGILTETNIGKLFIAGIIPGLVTIGLYIVAIGIQTSIDPKLGPPGERTPWRQRLVSLRGTWGIMLLFALVMGGIIAGIYTATEAAAVGAVGSFLIALMRRSLTLSSLIAILVDACKTTAVLMAVIVAAAVFTNFLDITGTPHHISEFLQSLDMTPMGILIVIICIYLVLGCFLEGMAMMLLTVPLFYPIVASLGFDLVYFGVLVIVVTELAMMTPPIGMNVFILKGTFPEISVRTIYRGVIPFVGADIVRLILFLMFPAIIMLLPNMAG
ncbi:MAG: TRAP transporter large permease subunit [Pigmentiphaga sp.]|nr:TRAP transporter large permease subunit [Pigmentiphaga sp.]